MESNPQANKFPFQLLGTFFLAWAAYNTFLDVSRYGASMGLYWWFCNLATFGIGLGVLFRWSSLLVGFISIAIFTQTLWISDNLAKLFTGEMIFGLVGSMYQPGLPMDEFVSVHYHYFTIPLAVLALMYFPRPDRRHTYQLIGFFNPFIFAVSYFAFPASQNVNCIHSACFKSLGWSGPVYSLLFWASVFAIHMFIAWVMLEFFCSGRSIRLRMPLRWGAGTLLLAGVICTGMDISYKLSLPNFACNDSDAGELDVRCQYTRNYDDDRFMLTYQVRNPTSKTQWCDITLEGGHAPIVIQRDLALTSGQSREMIALVPQPNTDLQGKLSSRCRPVK